MGKLTHESMDVDAPSLALFLGFLIWRKGGIGWFWMVYFLEGATVT